MHGTIRHVVSEALHICLLCLVQNVALIGYPGQQGMYALLRLEYYYLHIAKEFYNTVEDCLQCAKQRVIVKCHRHFTLFSPVGTLEFVAVDTFGPLPKTKDCARTVIIIMEDYSDLVPTLTTLKTTASYIARTHFKDRIIPYSIFSSLFNGNDTQLAAKLFQK